MSSRSARQSGQVMAELVLVFPVVLAVLLCLVQAAEVVVAHLTAGWAAKMAARAVAVKLDDPQEAREAADVTILRILAPTMPALASALETGMSPATRWTLRAQAYLALKRTAEWGGPVAATVSVRFADGSRLGLEAAAESLASRPHRVGMVEVDVMYAMRLRVPLANRLFSRNGESPAMRSVRASGGFPVMYAGRRT